MKNNKKILMPLISLLLLLFLCIIIIILLCKHFIFNTYKCMPYFELKQYENMNYILSQSDEQMITNILDGIEIFDIYTNKLNRYADVRIYIDEKDGNANGRIDLTFSEDVEEELNQLLQSSKKIISENNKFYNIDYKNVVIIVERSNQNDNKKNTKLNFYIKLPYKFTYTSRNFFPEYIKFFLNVK